MPIDPQSAEDLITKKEIAELANVNRGTVSTWLKRYGDFPNPAHRVGHSDLYRVGDIVAWLRTRDTTASHNTVSSPITIGSPAWKALHAAVNDDNTYSLEISHRYLGIAIRVNNRAWTATLPSTTDH